MNRFSRIQILLHSNPRLLKFLFNEKSIAAANDQDSAMRSDGETLLNDAGMLSHGEQIMLRIAISIWNGDAKVDLEEAISVLDQENFSCFLQAIAGFDKELVILPFVHGWG